MSAPRLRAGQRVYAVGDIHGRADLLRALLQRIRADLRHFPVERAELIFLGDYISRGPDSPAVLDLLIAEAPRLPLTVMCLKGNHEDSLLRFLDGDLQMGRIWLQYGGRAVLAAYGVRPVSTELRDDELAQLRTVLTKAIPVSHQQFLRSLPVSAERDDYFFVHAGLRPERALAEQTEHDLMWIREEFLTHTNPFERVVVHGHSPAALPEVRRNRINVDTGAYASSILTSVVLTGSERRFLATV
jgi:serine/threonine protein phosphatase 1